MFAPYANAFNFDSSFGSNNASSSSEFLPVEQAFVLSVNKQNNRLIATWQIKEGYYLYKHQLKLKGQDADKFAFSYIPKGEPKHDPYFGDVEVYHDTLDVEITPVGGLTKNTELEALIGYQGCAEKGLCYPPQTSPIYFTVHDSNLAAKKSTSFDNQLKEIQQPVPLENTKASTASSVTETLQSNSWQVSLGVMFGLGLLLSLTPCVLPMIPIVSAIVVGSKSTALKGLGLSFIYVVSMASTYALIGALAGLFGTQLNIQAALQSPIVISLSAALFVFLSFAMFGLFEIRLPTFLTNRLQNFSTQVQSNSNRSALSHYVAVAFSGVIATLIVSPCVSAPLAGVILYISSSGDSLYGAGMLFTMALGMGAPLLLVGYFGARALPKNGEWLNDIKFIMGFGLLSISIWLMSRFISGELSVALWAIFFLVLASYFIHRAVALASHPVRWFLALLSSVLAVSLSIGTLSGANNPATPFQKLALSGNNMQTQSTVPYAATIGSLSELDAVKAANVGHPMVLDLYADWCISCKVIEEEIFKSPDVYPYWKNVKIIRVDVTANSNSNKQLMQHFELFGPPSLVFINPQGKEEKELKVVGEPTKEEVIQRLQLLQQSRQG
ncbi:thiol:disulfide interchange protein DsbD [Marinomonas balearica]|uniref:Thiol:disulfide interchange protein DsbD n=2 Tax=Marinomonas balearica TaxID=491947 RepID=A0A4R6MC67_9GAMM|nr:thiol:disulfide interchange protein DsbD [Marinomonas balearica]